MPKKDKEYDEDLLGLSQGYTGICQEYAMEMPETKTNQDGLRSSKINQINQNKEILININQDQPRSTNINRDQSRLTKIYQPTDEHISMNSLCDFHENVEVCEVLLVRYAKAKTLSI